MATNSKRQVSIFVNGKEVEASAKSIAAAYRLASNELGRMVIGSDEYLDKLAEVRKLDGMLKQHREAVRGVEQGWNLAKGGMASFVGVAAGAFAVDSIIGYGQQLLGTATNLELLDKKAQTVFGETLPAVTAEAEKNARAVGLTNSEYIAAAANIQDLLVPMGFQRKEAAGISTEMVNLSGALSEWSGGQRSAAEVSDILTKSLLGERGALNSLGIDIKQAEVDSELLARGMSKLTGEARKQAEATVTLDLIMRKTVDAQAAFAEGAGSLSRRQAEMNARITETTEKLSRLLLPVFERLVGIAAGAADAVGWVVDAISRLTNPTKSATQAFDQQATKVADLESEITPLLARYDELAGQANLNATEQAELNKIIATVGGTIPGVITEFDKYGNAIGLNTEKAREFIETEKARLNFVNRDAIQSLESRRTKVQELIQKEEELYKYYQRQEANLRTSQNIDEAGIARVQNLIGTRQTQVQTLSQELRGLNAELERLQGKGLDKGLDATAPAQAPTGPSEADKKAAESAAKERQKKREQEAKELADHLVRIQEIVRKNEETAYLESLDADTRDIERVRIRYEKEIQTVTAKFSDTQAVRDAVVALEQQRETELEKIREEQRFKRIEAEVDAEIEEQERIAAIQKEYADKKQAAELDINSFSQEALTSELEMELLLLEQHYMNLLQAAEQYGIDSTALSDAYAKKRSDIETKYAQKTADEEAAITSARLAALQSSLSAFADLTSATIDYLAGEEAESAEFQKVATLAKIAFDTAAAISSLTAAANANPANAVTFGAAGVAQFVAGIAQIVSNMAQARKVLMSAPPVKQKAEGGFLSVTGESDGKTYHARPISPPNTGMLPGFPVLFQSQATAAPVLASERGAEYFVAAHDLRHPMVANLVRMVDNITHGRGGIPQFQTGGFNPPTTTPSTAPTTTPDNAPKMDMEAVRQLAEAVNTLNALLARGIVAVVPDRTITDISERFKEINTGSGGFFT
jgi:myosin heavy subunit